ncbi:hypothetical protein [Janthinobacterium sp. BJB304]|uniref:hypothetical protein n=1 Tax=Janthinobacterium sp. BJB304 TaxID=1572871 RepID=UPI000C0D2EEF|nr:hypothetical protein [Janthinobacterium sp. BJB304]PHV35630.1 hypothetical protein CSQ95_28540 [Janthinobacterium sp. BJB304]
MSNEGYEIYEPEVLGDWLGVVNNQAALVGFLMWLVEELKPLLLAKFPKLSLEVIKVEYLGTYPALGIKNSADYAAVDVAVFMESAIGEILQRTSVSVFLEFLFGSDVDWSEVANRMLNRDLD